MTDAPKTPSHFYIWRNEPNGEWVVSDPKTPYPADAIRAIPLPADDAPTEASYSEGFDFTAEQLQAMGEAWAAAYADALAERAVSDDDLVEKGARALAKLYGLEDFAPFYEDARVVLSAMRGEP